MRFFRLDHGTLTTLIAEIAIADVPDATETRLPASRRERLRLNRGKVTVTDGPFTETKEFAGFR
jgi:hypothetical protein